MLAGLNPLGWSWDSLAAQIRENGTTPARIVGRDHLISANLAIALDWPPATPGAPTDVVIVWNGERPDPPADLVARMDETLEPVGPVHSAAMPRRGRSALDLRFRRYAPATPQP